VIGGAVTGAAVHKRWAIFLSPFLFIEMLPHRAAAGFAGTMLPIAEASTLVACFCRAALL
jgi:hypothetical protein